MKVEERYRSENTIIFIIVIIQLQVAVWKKDIDAKCGQIPSLLLGNKVDIFLIPSLLLGNNVDIFLFPRLCAWW